MTIAFLSDFGVSEYPGIVKGVIRSTNAQADIIDLSHAVKPGAILEGSWILYTSFRFFPRGTIFLAVVDPGVGSSRQAVAIETASYFFVGPDNGLLFQAASADVIKSVACLERDISTLRHAFVSNTFHARDVFGPAAALLSAGIKFETLGAPVKLECELSLEPKRSQGLVVHVDSFGNIVTNVLFPAPEYGGRSYEVTLETAGHEGDRQTLRTRRLSLRARRCYADATSGELFVLEGSSNTLEISAKNAAASEVVEARIGDVITVS
jgi:S-adenosyl-L-methionine hydrolase (adenosine-forming)